MVTKAGSNTFQGTAYEYNQTRYLEANTFTNNASGQPRSPFLRNQFGANYGGPVKRNKAFFFFDYYGMRNRTYSTRQLLLPGMAMRKGDFSALCPTYANGVCASPSGTQLYNPFTGAPFPNNQIPSNMITPQAQALNAFLPAPTGPLNMAGVPSGSPNYWSLVGTAQVMNAYDIRLDYHLSDADQLTGMFSYNIGSPFGVYLNYTPTYGEATNFGYKTIDYSLVETHTFNPNTLNDFRFAWFDHPYIRAGQNLDFDPTTLFPQLPASKNRGLPTMTMTGYTGMFYDYGNGVWGHVEHQEYRDGLTWVHNGHTFKFGAQVVTYKSFAPSVGGPLGSFSFNGQWTGNKGWPGQPHSQGNAYADFLLGVANTSVVSTVPQLEQVYSDWDTEFYAQDTWQASKRLTLIYGLRYSYQTPWQWQDGYSTYWDQVTNQLALPENSTTATFPAFAASPAGFAAYNFTTTQALGIPKSYMLADPRDWAPRLGLAYRPFGDTRTVFRAGFGVFYNFNAANEGSRQDVSNPPWTGYSQTYSTLLPGNPTAPYLPDITFSNPFPTSLSTGTGVSAHPTIYSMQRNFSMPRVLQWNGTLEHQFTSNWAGRITYAGSETNHLQFWGENLNTPLVQIPNTPLQNQVPYQPWSTVYATRFGGDASFQQLQLEATKRLANDSLLQVEYSWTRELSDVDTNVTGEPEIPSKPLLDYGNATNIRKQTLVFNYLYRLPFGRGKLLLPNIGRWADAVVGGWEVTGISTYMSGAPFSVTFTVPTNYIGWTGGRASTVPGEALYSDQQSGHNIVSGVQWFNPAAFTAPAPYTWGDSAKNTLWGPGMWNWDISAAKEFKASERMRLRVRCDFLDAFNHFNLSNPQSTIGATQYGGLANTSAGKIFGGSGNRVIQVGAKLVF